MPKGQARSTPSWITAISTLILAVVGVGGLIIGLVTATLPTTRVLKEIIREVGNEIADRNVKRMEDCVAEVIHVVVDHQYDPSKARADVYKEALVQARDKGYVFEIRRGYVTSHGWRDPRLLTDTERQLIDQIVRDRIEQDQMSLMYLVLTDARIPRKLSTDRQMGPKEVHISPYEKIGVIGGYIGELKFE